MSNVMVTVTCPNRSLTTLGFSFADNNSVVQGINSDIRQSGVLQHGLTVTPHDVLRVCGTAGFICENQVMIPLVRALYSGIGLVFFVFAQVPHNTGRQRNNPFALCCFQLRQLPIIFCPRQRPLHMGRPRSKSTSRHFSPEASPGRIPDVSKRENKAFHLLQPVISINRRLLRR